MRLRPTSVRQQLSNGATQRNHRRSKMLSIIALVACSAVVASIQVHGGDHGHHEKPNFPTYKFGYGVRDQYTHDYKGQWEHRDGDVVKGQYTIDEPDGTHRLVEYSSDAHNGLKVFVRRKGLAHHPHGESYNNFDLSY